MHKQEGKHGTISVDEDKSDIVQELLTVLHKMKLRSSLMNYMMIIQVKDQK